MRSLSRILLPVDFSERAAGAARYSRCLAGACASEIVLLHALAPLQYQFGVVEMGGVMLGDIYQDQLEHSRRELERFREAHLAGLNSRILLLEGDPATEIVTCAHREQAGLIVMPTHGYGPFRRFILGSNTAKVLHDADCPVWTGVHMADDVPAAKIALQHILCAVDLGPQSARALEWAIGLRRLLGARLTLMHVTTPVPDTGDAAEEAWRVNLRWTAEKELERVQKAVGIQEGDAPALLLESGEPPAVICAAAARLHADILVIGRGSASGVFGRLRTNAYAIIRQSPCPVASV
jgi:nucleotide-binding universal stress UspA family protein